MKCPGQDMQFWNEAAIFEASCPGCGKTIEFYKDDTNRKCSHCGNRMVNPRMDFGCASYCQYAEQCLGTLPEEFVSNRDNLLKDRVAVEVKRFLKSDFRRIGHAIKVAQNAEKIGKEEGGNIASAVCAAYLLEAGEAEAINRHASEAAGHRNLEAQAVTKTILEKLGAKETMIADVCNLIDHTLSAQDRTHPAYPILADAQVLAALEEENKRHPLTADRLTKDIDQNLLTEGGRTLAKILFPR